MDRSKGREGKGREGKGKERKGNGSVDFSHVRLGEEVE